MIRCAVRTRAGHLHDGNQDRVATDVDRGTFIVADGMGSLADAAATAQAIVDQFPRRVWERVTALRGPDVTRAVTAVAAELNERVRHSAQRTGHHGRGHRIAARPGRSGAAGASGRQPDLPRA
ncbi:hypothetical protein [Protofrankia symbiont of Coriaria ruscifolia]|uniref:hypothetical protein n=1 Tax=Protofrankia symbiont of Coriaria ruscifolia TaxID=1306542 RepID=UPI001041AEA0|nr:hypothetical protein [Protofrankia symbiont of Coriaria ruscifolia]